MKTRFWLLSCLCVIAFSCNSGSDEKEDVIYETVRDTASVKNSDSALTVVNHPSLWRVENQGSSQKEKLKQPSDSAIRTYSSAQIISTLNEDYPDVQLELKTVSHDTMYVSIPNSNRLTQEMGNTGAYNYLATAVYNLTELKNIKFVNFNFTPGDHAEPGVFNRNDFKRLR